jgi:galactokinase
MIAELAGEFQERFKTPPQHIFFCPGRINLIGEHIDYNGGQVMPCAISPGTGLAVSKNTEKLLRFQCLDFPEKAELHLQTSYSKTGKEWFNYPLGVVDHFTSQELAISGLNMLFAGNLPIGSGLSSSASIEVLMAFSLASMFGIDMPKTEMAQLSKKVENQFIGVNCGIMDQFAVAMGQKNKAILLNCDTLEFEYLPLHLQSYTLAIINTNKTRKLSESKYNERFAECGLALKALKKELTVEHLCDISVESFQQHRHLIGNTVLEKRALHVVSENERVHAAVTALKGGDLTRFGKLMYASHESLKELYGVSGKELDTIVECCAAFEGCIGARMTGAGFGGCAIALVEKNGFAEFAKRMTSFYKERIGYEPHVFSSEVGDGVRQLS